MVEREGSIRQSRRDSLSSPQVEEEATKAMKRRRINLWLLAAYCVLAVVPSLRAQLTLAAKQQAVAAHFEAGRKAMQAGRFGAAESEFRKAVGLLPEVAEARANLGLALYLQGKYEETIAELETVAKQRPDLQATNVFLGLSHLKLGSPEKAAPSLEKALRAAPSNLEARRALSACYLAVGRYSDAVEQFRAVFSHEPDKTEAWFRLGRDYMALMRNLAGRLVSGQPDSAWTSRLGGDMLGLSKHWDAAIPYHQETLEKVPGLPGVNRSLGAAHLQMGRWEQAEKHFRAELEVDPLDEAGLLGLAEVHLARGEAREALENITQVWRSSPHWLLRQTEFPVYEAPREAALALMSRLSPETADGPSHFLRSVLRKAAGQAARAAGHRAAFEKAVGGAAIPEEDAAPAQELFRRHRYAALAQLLQSRPKLDAASYLMLGKAQLGLQDYDAASLAFSKAMGPGDDSPEAVYWAVKTFQILADLCFRRVEELSPHSWRAHHLRAEAHRQRQDDDEAVTEYRLAIKLKPDEAELYRSLGLLYFLDNTLDQAQEALAKALDLDPGNARGLYFMGRLFVTKQQPEEAVPFLEAALRLDPNLVEARPNLGKAYLRLGRFKEAAVQLEKGLALDYYGDVHYSLFQAQRRLGNKELATKALERSKQMRKNSFARDRAKFDRWLKDE